MQKPNIRKLLPEELEALMKEMGEQSFRAKQIFQWTQRGVKNFDEMTNLSEVLRQKLRERFTLSAPQLLEKLESTDGTIKYLWELSDGNTVETVLMRYRHGNTVCISSQVGCRMGCTFCASTIGGLVRNLDAGEMLEEVLFTELDAGVKISNIVLMGIGEPLDNFEQVLRFLKLVNHPGGLNIGMRHITLSTCGLIEEIDKLASNHLQLTLSISLHAPDDETRNQLMPISRQSSVRELLEAAERYYKQTGRRVSFEYAMIDGVNDTPEHARRLAKCIKEIGGHVNLIPLNPVAERALGPSTREKLERFENILRQAGVNVTLRRSLGGDIDASCGQLRRRKEKEGNA